MGSRWALQTISVLCSRVCFTVIPILGDTYPLHMPPKSTTVNPHPPTFLPLLSSQGLRPPHPHPVFTSLLCAALAARVLCGFLRCALLLPSPHPHSHLLMYHLYLTTSSLLLFTSLLFSLSLSLSLNQKTQPLSLLSSLALPRPPSPSPPALIGSQGEQWKSH